MRIRNGNWAMFALVSAAVCVAASAMAQPVAKPQAFKIEAAADSSALVTQSGGQGAAQLTFTTGPGLVSAKDGRGTLVWKVRVPDRETPTVTRSDRKTVTLDNGYVIDARTGRVLERRVAVPGAESNDDGNQSKLPTRGSAYWDTYQDVTDGNILYAVVFENNPVDGVRHAWVFYSNDGDEIYARRSEGHDQFGDPVFVMNSYGQVAVAIDSSDNITVVTRRMHVGEYTYSAWAARYEPGTGWQSETMIYGSNGLFQDVAAVADHSGNVVALFGSHCLIYNTTSATWTETPFSLGGRPETEMDHVLGALKLVGNRSGTAIYVVYPQAFMIRGDNTLYRLGSVAWQAVFANRLDLDTMQWSEPVMVPGAWSDWAECLAVVDELGEATVVWTRRRADWDGTELVANRTVQGVWQRPEVLVHLTQRYYTADWVHFGSIDVNAAGDVIAVVTNISQPRPEDEYVGWLHAFRYRAGSGWDDAQFPHSYGYNQAWITFSKSRVCFYDGDKAVATSLNIGDSGYELTSVLYDGTAWSSELLAFPVTFLAKVQEMAGAQGTAALFFDDDSTDSLHTTWLRGEP